MAGTGFFVFFGWLSDKIGRKGIMMVGMLLAILTYRPIYEKIYQTANIKNKTEIAARSTLDSKTILKTGTTDSVMVTNVSKTYTDGTVYNEETKLQLGVDKEGKAFKADIKTSIKVGDDSFWTIVLLIFIQVLYVTMVYGPIAAFLVEMFPTKIRYTSMSLPYHIGNGIFGGLLPAIATYLATNAKSANDKALEAGLALPYDKPYLEGLWYPIIVAGVCFVIGMLYINKKMNHVEE
jgi:MFS family permease